MAISLGPLGLLVKTALGGAFGRFRRQHLDRLFLDRAAGGRARYPVLGLETRVLAAFQGLPRQRFHRRQQLHFVGGMQARRCRLIKPSTGVPVWLSTVHSNTAMILARVTRTPLQGLWPPAL